VNHGAGGRWRRRGSVFATLRMVCFLAVLVTPLIRTALTPKAALSDSEKRTLTEIPRLELTARSVLSFPARFEAYLNDHFGFRRECIQAFNYLQVRWLRRSPEEQVVLGRDGWLFYTGDRSIEDHRGFISLTPEELTKARLVLENRRDWLADRGIRYLFVVAPSKHSIYPELLPDFLARRRGRTRFDQFLAYMGRESDFQVLDLRQILWSKKGDERLYLLSDTHWNPRGAYWAYTEIMRVVNQWFPEEEPLERSRLIETSADVPGGDLAQMLDLRGLFRESYPFLRSQEPCAVKKKEAVDLEAVRRAIPIVPGESAGFARGCDRSRLRAVAFRDSFLVSLEDFLAEHFAQIDFIWTHFDHSLVEKYIAVAKPDVILEEIVERSFMEVLVTHDLDVDALLSERFSLSKRSVLKYEGGVLPGLRTFGDVLIAGRPEGLDVVCRDSDPQLWLPPAGLDGDSSSIMRILLTAPADTVFQVFYHTAERPYHCEEQSIRRPVRRGLNELYIEIPRAACAADVRLDPGAVPGTYTLHEFDWRTRSDSHRM